MTLVKCKNCGSLDLSFDGKEYVCGFCGAHISEDEYKNLEIAAERLRNEQLSNYKKTCKDILYRKKNKLIDNDTLKQTATLMKGLNPDDAFADFVLALTDYKLTGNYQSYERVLAILADQIIKPQEEVKEIADILLRFPDTQVREAIENFFKKQNLYEVYKNELDLAFRASENEKDKYLFTNR